MKNLQQNIYFYLLVFFIINIFQTLFTPISQDEAYYWMYSRNLDWGFFDHPPMIALFIKIGGLVFHGILGVRFMTILVTTLTLLVVWKLVPEYIQDQKNSMLLFFLLAFSLPIFNIYGFITTPDVPLLFFSALYLYIYLKFLDDSNVINALKLGLVAALLMYSKYHGAFVIIFSVIANIRLLWNRSFYLAGIVGVLLYLPHLIWQYDHEFISFRYHLIQRTDGFMGGKHILDYFLNAFVILNPFLLGMFLYYIVKGQSRIKLPGVFYFVFWGFICFFGFTSFRDHIEPQWIGVASIPMLVILLGFIQQAGPTNKFVRPVLIGSFVLVLSLRIGLVLPLEINSEFHKQKQSFYETIREQANPDPVVFINTYYDAAKYTYYTGDPAFSYNCYDYRKNQYDFWDYETTYHLKPAYMFSGFNYSWSDSSLVLEGRTLYTERFNSFPMINKARGEWLEVEQSIDQNRIQSIEFSLYNPYTYPFEFDHPDLPLSFFIVFQFGLERILVPVSTDVPDVLNPGETIHVRAYYYSKVPAGKYRVAIGLQPIQISPVLITEKIEIQIQ